MKLEIRDVVQRFEGTEALTRTSLAVRDGEFVSIVGPSGCGKSTLFNIVSGILRPTSGQVLLDQRDITASPGHVGYMLQKDLLLPWKTALENITLGAALTRRVTRNDREQAAILASRYGLGDFLNHYPHAMSGGMRQRVALMRTLAFARDVMLLDEPFGALDSQTRMEMQQWLLGVWAEQRSTILFVTDDVDEAIFLADRVVVMSARPGRIQQIFDVGLPRPRELDTLTDPCFTALKHDILALIYAHAGGSAGTPQRSNVIGNETRAGRERRETQRGKRGPGLDPPGHSGHIVRRAARGVDVPGSRHARRPVRGAVTQRDVWRHPRGLERALAGTLLTAEEFVVGFVAGTTAGFVLAVLMSQSGWIRRALYPVLIASQAVPIIAIGAALVIWLGFGLAPKVVIVARSSSSRCW